jgi:hypothetical protein
VALSRQCGGLGDTRGAVGVWLGALMEIVSEISFGLSPSALGFESSELFLVTIRSNHRG